MARRHEERRGVMSARERFAVRLNWASELHFAYRENVSNAGVAWGGLGFNVR